MRKFKLIFGAAMLSLLVGCGDGDTLSTGDNPIDEPPGPPPVVVSSLEVLTSNPQIPSDGGVPATITALVRDANNTFVSGQTVVFSASSGGLSIPQDPDVVGTPQATTDENGRATAELTAAGDPTNRVITVTATSGDLTATVLVEVTGTQLTISGPETLVLGAAADYSIVLADAAGDGIANQVVDLSSSLGNTLAATTLTTDFSGRAEVSYTAITGGSDTFQATALGETAATTISVSADTFTFIAPMPVEDIDLGASETITVRWVQNNMPRNGETVTFSTTRGTINPASVVTDANGDATTTVTASNSGPATVTATATNGPVASLPLEFVAVTPDNLEVQADPFTVAPNSQSTITAILRDAAGNLVKNKRITFTLDDITGGSLSVSSSVTDSQGRAQTFYTSNTTTSSVDGVTITAVVDEVPTITDEISLTVAGREVFFTFGTGNTISEPNEAQYQKVYVVQVTDADGNAVSGVEVSMSVVSVNYVKGFWWADTVNDVYNTRARARCDDEDINRNGILDPGEDFNSSGQIEAGNVATVSPGNFITDTVSGQGLINLLYPQEFGGWLEVELQARASVQGTEFSEKSFFVLEVLADDVNDLEQAPPGRRVIVDDLNIAGLPANVLNGINGDSGVFELFSSPFGYNDDCTVWEFGN